MANLLLDTHILIWFVEGDKKLPRYAVEQIVDVRNLKFISIASIWEIVIKSSKDKLDFKRSPKEIMRLCDSNGIKLINIDLRHLNTLQTLPQHHGDPFDRMLIAQAITEGLTIISADRQFSAYPVNVSY